MNVFDRKNRAFSALALGAALLLLPACSTVRSPVVRTTPQRPPAPAAPVESTEDTGLDRAGADAPADVEENLLDLVGVGVEQDAEDDPAIDVTGEAITESPLDVLAEVEPGPPAEAWEAAVPAETAPEFDIPMEVNDRVLSWVGLYTGSYRRSTLATLERSGRYLEMFREIFAEAGLPQDLVYMAHVESAYKTSAYSRAHARGVFQFITGTARRYGLRVDYWVDERSDPEKSARAAAAYMKKLYDDFGDWYLALAAYNAGEGKVQRAIDRTGKTDFWSLAATKHLRLETRNHIPAILAAALISKRPGDYGLEFVPEPPVRYDTITVDGAADLNVLARCAESDLETLKVLNPALRRLQTPPDGRTDVRVPEGRGPMTLAALTRIPSSERVLYAMHRVRQGDTLSAIARKHGVPIEAIQTANNLGRKSMIRIGQELRIPTSTAARGAVASADVVAAVETRGEPVTYRVRRGDTLHAIARRYRTTASAVAAASSIRVDGVLSVGQKLKIVPGVDDPTEAVAVARGVAPGSSKTEAALAPNDRSSGKVIHTVRQGDSLWQIAMRYGTSVAKICSLNGMTPRATLYPGRQLTVMLE